MEQQIIKQYIEGKKINDICNAFNCSRKKIYNTLKRNKIQRRPKISYTKGVHIWKDKVHSRLGKKHSENSKKKMSTSRIKGIKEGRIKSWCFGKTKENNTSLLNNSIKHLDSNNINWKEDVGYGSLHEWVRRRKIKPEYCEECKKNKPIDLANVSGEYKRDINDFRWLCRRCHMREDKRILNLKQYSKLRKVTE